MGGMPKLTLALVLSALLALAVTACGGGGSASSSDAAAAAKAEPTGAKATAEGTDAAEPSATFRTPGGDNSIQTFGVEAAPGERRAASTVLEAYMKARSGQDWTGACLQLAPAAFEALEKLVAPGSGCAGSLAEIFSRLTPSAWDNTMSGPIAALRREGGNAFALYHGTAGSDYFIQMNREGSEWKVAALEPTPFP